MCHISRVTPLNLILRPGESIFDQGVFAARKAFPSVRALAADLRIHPNTAHKVIQHLIAERWLEARPGIGTVVAPPPQALPGDKKRLLQTEVEQLVVEAKRVGAGLEDVIESIE